MYILVMALIFAMRADARAIAETPIRPRPLPKPTPKPTPASAPVAPPPTAKSLLVVSGALPTSGREYPLFDTLEIGRGSACAIVIPNHFVSTRHVRIFQMHGRWMIEDVGSTNGTSLNGHPLAAPQPLLPGDKILVGDTEFLVQ
jgi:hypothetical protein